jgi:hypothetical protein
MKEILMALGRRLNIIPVPMADLLPRLCLARGLMEANRFGVFKALEAAPAGLSVEEVAGQTELSPEGARVLLNAMEKGGYLVLRDGRYRNGPWARKWITSDEHGLANFINLQINTWDRLGELRTPLTTGKPVQDHHLREVTEPSARQEVYTQAMRETSRLHTPSFLKVLDLPDTAKTLVDLGGAHGDMARAVLSKYPHLQATVMDLPGPLATAEHIHEEEGNPYGIRLQPCNVLADDLGEGWDVALLCQFIHCFTAEANRDIFRRLYKAMNPGGVVIILDQFTGLGRIQDSIAGLVSLAYFTLGSKTYSCDEVDLLLRESGFARSVVKRFPRRQPTAVIEGWKL